MIIFLSGRISTGLKYGFIDKIKDLYLAWKWSKKLWEQGHIVYSPHLNNIFFQGIIEHDEWMKKNYEIIDMCEAVYFLPNWKKSKGACAEYDYAKETNKIIKKL